VTPALFCDENLSSLVICRMVNLSLEHGNSDGSCFAYVWFAIIAGPRFGNYKDGFRFGRLGYELVEKRGLKRFQARTYMSFGDIVMPWTRHVRAGRDLVRRAFDAANEIGDLTFAAYSCDHLIKNFLAAGDPLVDVQREAENALKFAQKVRFGLVIDHITAQLGLIRTLRGLTPKFGSFDDEGFDELRFERRLARNAALAELECWYWIRKLQARFFAGDYASAVDASLRAQHLLWTSPSQFEVAEYRFYGALSHAASCDSGLPDQRQQHFEALAAHHKQLAIWAENCPENFENRATLVGAEIARIECRDLDAMRLYEQAIRSARANAFVHNEALANELAARFYAARGFEKIADAYLRDARYGYLRWGATGKVRQLDELYPQLSAEKPLAGSASTIGTPVEHLDLAAVIKVSQAVSGEMVLDKLIDTLMGTAIEHAGAERGLLIFPRGDEQRIEAEATTSGDTVIVHQREAVVGAVPESIVHYVARTKESVILDDAVAQNPFSADPYIRQRHARSILCLPLINQGKLIRVLYLENNLTPHVFTPTRIAVLKLLASQAAISLENTRLYADLEEREKRYRVVVETANDAVLSADESGAIQFANPATSRIFGYESTELIGKPLTVLMPKRIGKLHENGFTRYLATGQRHINWKGAEFTGLRKNGEEFPVEVSFGELTKDGHRVFTGFIRDISERKQAEEAQQTLQMTQGELARVSRLTTMGELAASIAHEVNQPLTAVTNNSNACLRLLADNHLEPEVLRRALEEIVADGNRASAVMARIRALIKKTPTEKNELDINEVIQEVLALTGRELYENRIRLERQLTDTLPPVLADRVQLQQVLLNLMVNAIEAMTAVTNRTRLLWVESRMDESGDILVAVRDSGTGLGSEADRVFTPFFTTKANGMGMGLRISRSLIEGHGGRLWATPNFPHGTVFSFTLPVAARSPL
jgi:PAS domain S-box-containing protein